MKEERVDDHCHMWRFFLWVECILCQASTVHRYLQPTSWTCASLMNESAQWMKLVRHTKLASRMQAVKTPRRLIDDGRSPRRYNRITHSNSLERNGRIEIGLYEPSPSRQHFGKLASFRHLLNKTVRTIQGDLYFGAEGSIVHSFDRMHKFNVIKIYKKLKSIPTSLVSGQR